MAANLRREAIDASLSPSLLRSTMLARDKGASSWLNAVPLEEQGLTLNKQQFRDSLCLRYNLQLADLSSHCACGDRFTVSHALSCKKGFCCTETWWHPEPPHVSAQQSLQECRGRAPPPTDRQSTVTSHEARLDIKAGSFWSRGETANACELNV